MRAAGVGHDWIEAQAAEQMREIARRRQLYLHGRAPLAVQGCSAVVVDDGIATGSTLRAALKASRNAAMFPIRVEGDFWRSP